MHRRIEPDSLLRLASQLVLLSENFDQLGRELLLGVGIGLVGVLAHLHEKLSIVELFHLVSVLLYGAAYQAVLSQFLRAAVAGIHEGIDRIGDFTGRIIFVQLPLDPFLAELPVELDGGHMREPQVLLLAAVVLPRHLEVELDLGLVLRLVHEHADLEGVERQQVVVTADHVDDLL